MPVALLVLIVICLFPGGRTIVKAVLGTVILFVLYALSQQP